MEDIVDADVVPDEQVPEEQLAVDQRSELVPVVPREQSVLRPLPTQELVESFKEYQALRGQLLDATDYQDAGRGKSFVKKSGWRKIATAFGLDLSIVSMDVERDEDGRPLRASCIARATAANGRHADGDGFCDVAEDRFSGPRGNKSKLENDLRTTATTRATNRAISNLVGMGEVSADEVDGGHNPQLPYGEAASEEMQERLHRALVFLADGDAAVATEVYNATGQTYQYIPQAVAASLIRAAVMIHNRQTEGPASDTPNQEAAQDEHPDGDPVQRGAGEPGRVPGDEPEPGGDDA
jgi:hypothetical protein